MSCKLPVVPLLSSAAWYRRIRLMAMCFVLGAATITFPAISNTLYPTNSDSLILRWSDNAVDETHYQLTRRQGTLGAYEPLITLPADSSEFSDMDVAGGEIYCYQVFAVNDEGASPPAEACAIAPPLDDDLAGWGEIAVEVTVAPDEMEIAGREYLTLANLVGGNEQASAAAIGMPLFEVNSGEEQAVEEYRFVEAGEIVDSGMRQIPFHDFNAIALTLTGAGEWQTATLLVRAGAWGAEGAGFTLAAGGNSRVIPLPAVDQWHYYRLRVRFAETLDLVLRPASSDPLAGGLGLAAVLIEEIDDGSVEPWATISAEGQRSYMNPDVTGLEYLTGNRHIYGNPAASTADIGEPQWSVPVGEVKSRTSSRIRFWDNGLEVDSGYTKMRFDQTNTLDVLLTGDDTEQTAVFYLAVKAWHRSQVSFTVTAAGAVQQVVLPSSFGWHYFKVRVAFRGEVSVRFRPDGHLNQYSTLGLGGVVLEP